MRSLPRPNKVAYGVPGRRPPWGLTLLKQNDRASGEAPDAVRRPLSIARPSQIMCAVA